MKVSQLQQHYDLAIIGGGMVGASFALALAQMQKRSSRKITILVIESKMQSQITDESADFDARTTALSYGSKKIYQRLGLWGELLAAVVPIKKIHVSDRGHFGATRIDAESLAVDALGYVAENRQIGKVLHQALEDSAVIEFLCPAKITRMNPQASGMELLISSSDGSNSQQISADLVVLADGGKSALCEQLGIANAVTEYEQTALITNIAFSQAHDNVAYERFTDSGPLAVLPLATVQNEHRGALIWTLPQEQAEKVLGLPEKAFLSLLQQRFGRRLGRITKAGKRIAYPLSLTVAREQIRPGLALLGNVAHTLHPVAGQGLNLALRDAQALAEVITAAVESGQSPGSMAVLQNFVDQQQRDQSNTINFSHYITRLFSSNNPTLVWARKSGLFSIDLVPVIKTAFTRQAMGLMDRKTNSSQLLD